jgi:truncated hemoglobin YjbI
LHQLKFFKLAFTEIPPDFDVVAMILEKHLKLFEDGLNETHFDIVAGHFVAVLQHFGVSQPLIDEAAGVIIPLRPVFEQGGKKYGPLPSDTSDTASMVSLTSLEVSDNDDTPKTLTQKLGGTEALIGVVDELYRRLMNDNYLKRFFDGADMASLKIHQLHFLSHMFDYDKGDTPTGQEERFDILIRKTHQRLFREMGLNENHFDHLTEHLVITLKSFKVKKDVMDEVFQVLKPMRKAFEQGAFDSEQIQI